MNPIPLFKTIAALFSVNAMTLAGGLALHICLSRILGAEAAGVFAAASASALLLAATVDFGFDISLPRSVGTFAATPNTAPERLSMVLLTTQRAKNLLWSLGFVIVTVIAFSTETPLVAACAALYALWVLPRSAVFTFSGVLRGLQVSSAIAHVENAVTIASHGLACGVIVLLNAQQMPSAVCVLGVIALLLLAESIKTLWLWRVVRTHAELPPHKGVSGRWMLSLWAFLFDKKALLAMLDAMRSGQRSLVASQILSAAEARAGIYALQLLSSATTIGYFATAQRFVSVLRTLPGAAFNALLPALSGKQDDSTNAPENVFAKLTLLLVSASVVVSGIVHWLAEPIITLVYGAAFAPSVPMLQILVWLFPLQMTTHTLEAALFARGKDASVNVGLLASLAVIAATNLAFTPSLGGVGAACSALAGNVVLALFYTVVAMRSQPAQQASQK